MTWIAEIGRKLRMWFRGEQFDRDLQEEIRLHMELRQREQVERGVEPEAARAAAQRRFGNQTLLGEYSRDAWIEIVERCQDAGLHRRSGAVDDLREDVVAERVRAEEMLARRVREDRLEVRLLVRVGSDQRREHGDGHERERDDQPDHRQRAPEEAPAHDSPAAGRRAQPRNLDVAHVGLPDTRIRGLRIE